MTLTELRYVVTLAKLKHFGKAATKCHVSQPTLSVAITKLENELGVHLFERDRNNIYVTDVGQKVVSYAQQILDSINELKDVVKQDLSQLNSPLRMGAIYTIAPYIFPFLIPKLKKAAPHMPLIIQEDFTANLRVKLRQGELDVIIISLPFSEKGVETHVIYEEPFVVVMPKDSPLCNHDAITIDDLANEQILLLGEGHCFRTQVLEVCPNCYQNNASQQTIEGTSIETLRHMVASGLGITILPSSATQIQYYKSSLVVKPFKGIAPSRQVALAWRASFTRPKAIQLLTQLLQTAKNFL